MGRHTFLDTILNRPSQNYAPPAPEYNGQHRGGSASLGRGAKYAGPTDLPNAPNSAPQNSMLSNSFFRRKSKTGSTYGGSVAGSDVGGAGASTSTLGRGRFRRKQHESIVHHYPPELRPGYEGSGMPLPSAGPIAPSVADSTASKSKKKWWGSLGGRRSRAPSVAGESIFSEPELPSPAHSPWNQQGRLQGMDARSPRRSTQSELGSPTAARHRQSGASIVPPVPAIPAHHIRNSSQGSFGKPGAPYGRLQSNVAPLGSSTLNPTLSTKPVKSRAMSGPSNTARGEGSLSHIGSTNGSARAMSPPLPPASPTLSQASGRHTTILAQSSSRPTSPMMRYPSPPISESGISRARSSTGLRGQATGPGPSSDWKNFVQSFSGSNISKVWEGGRVGSPDLQSAVRARTLSGGAMSQRNDRKWLQIARVQKELEEEAQSAQILRDPGVVHQDLLARAASVVVGQTPLHSNLRPGAIMPGTASTTGPSNVVRPVATRPEAETQEQQFYSPLSSPVLRPLSSLDTKRQTQQMAQNQVLSSPQHARNTSADTPLTVAAAEEEEEEESGPDSSSEGNEEGSIEEVASPQRRQHMLEAVREEDEESSLAGRSSRRTSRALTENEFSVQKPQPADKTTGPSDIITNMENQVAAAESGHGTGLVPEYTGDASSSSEVSTTAKHQGLDESSSDEEETTRPKVSKYALALQSKHSASSQISSSDSEMETAEESQGEQNEDDETSGGLDSNARLPTATTSGSLASAVSSQESEATSSSAIDSHVESQSDDASQRSEKTGKATVKFDGMREATADPMKGGHSPPVVAPQLSRSASLDASTRPALNRKISDVSLGTSFGLSNMLRSGSRASTRPAHSRHGSDKDSGEVPSDDDGDEDLKARIKAESDRLRSIKVGEDFFGGSFSTILDKFDKIEWNAKDSSNPVGALGLEVGASSAAAAARTPEAILALNAEERISEVRRRRTEDATSGRPKNDHSDTKTVDSIATPSVAALWLLNQAGASAASADMHTDTSSQGTLTQNHSRQGSESWGKVPLSTSVATMSSASHISDGLPRSSSLWSVPNRGDSLRKASLAAPPEPIARGEHSVLHRPRPRKPKPEVMGGVKIASTHLDAAEAKVEGEAAEDTRSTLDRIWRGPEDEESNRKQLATLMQSKDKPAPPKSAIKKVDTPKSLADTLFSIKPFSSADKESKKSKSIRRAEQDAADKPSEASNKSHHAKADNSRTNGAEVADVASTSLGKSQPVPTSTSPPTISDKEGERPSPDLREGEKRTKPIGASQKAPELSRSVPSDDGHSTDSSVSERGADIVSPPPASEGWSASSTLSTGGPTTPSPSEMLMQDKFTVGNEAAKNLHASSISTNCDTQGRRQSDAETAQGDITDTDRTPMLERQEPQFGVNLIPPTPPATSDSQPVQLLQLSSSKPVLNRTPSTRSRTTLKNEDGLLVRSGSAKAKSLLQYPEYKGRGLSLPPGLVATTVASSASRRKLPDSVPEEEPTFAEINRERKSNGKKSKKSSKALPPKPTQNASSDVGGGVHRDQRVPAELSAIQIRSGEDTRRSMSDNLATLAPPSPSKSSDGSCYSNSSDINPASRPASPAATPSPSVTASGQSSAVSSSAQSDTSSRGRGLVSSMMVPPPIPRKIRTVTAGTNGHARTSLMSAISEWESSPVDRDASRSQSPLPNRMTSPRLPNVPIPTASDGAPPSSVARSDTSVVSGVSPSIVRNAPLGAPTAAILNGASQNQPAAPSTASSYAPSNYGRESPAPWRDSYIGGGSVMSHGGMSDYSVTSLPAVPQSSSAYRPKDPVKASNAIDDRLYAKTTMLTVAVTSGAFRSKSLRQRKSSSTIGDENSNRSSENVQDLAHVEELRRTIISVTSHTAPPRKMSSTQVLVQVIACALDEMDRLILRDRVRSGSAYGFVPGRSFCGRVMETGWEVKRLRKGDVIFGLQTSKKCGALAEFLTIEQELVTKAPEDCLTTEQIAALPSVGILSHQLMVNHCSQLPRGARILILNAHDGVGLLTMQNCASLGLIIVAHCPQHIADGVAICEANGAHEVIVGEPLWALNTLHESSLDLVIDTIGGRRIYDAARRTLAFEGQFCTCFGDLHSSTANPNLRSHLRSLRRSFFKKDTKRIGYEWVGTDLAEDNHEALEAVRQAAEDGAICPRLKSVLAFADAPRAFESTLRGSAVEGDEPGAIVVRVG